MVGRRPHAPPLARRRVGEEEVDDGEDFEDRWALEDDYIDSEDRAGVGMGL